MIPNSELQNLDLIDLLSERQTLVRRISEQAWNDQSEIYISNSERYIMARIYKKQPTISRDSRKNRYRASRKTERSVEVGLENLALFGRLLFCGVFLLIRENVDMVIHQRFYGSENTVVRKRLLNSIIPAIITSIITIFNLIIPAVFAGGFIYSILIDTIPKDTIMPIFLDYLKHCLLYVFSGVMGWIIYTLTILQYVDLSNLYIPALFSILYYHILLFFNQYRD